MSQPVGGQEPVRGQGPVERDEPFGRAARWRARAEAAGDRYEELAQRRPEFGLPLEFLARYASRQAVIMASAAAFRMFLWVMPFVLIAAGILSAFADSDTSELRTAGKVVGVTGVASKQVIDALHDGHRSWGIAVVTGAFAFLWATRNLVRTFTLINAQAWQVPRPRRDLRSTLVTTLLLAGSWILMFGVAGLTTRLGQVTTAGAVLAVPVEVLSVAGLWFLIVRRLPDKRRDWIDLVPGCLVVGAALSVMHWLSETYLPVRLKHSSELYGSLGVAAAILAWLLIIGQVFVVSALLNSVWSEFREGRASPTPEGPGPAGAAPPSPPRER